MTEPTIEERLKEWKFASHFVVGEVDVIRHNLRRALRQACVEIRRLLEGKERWDDGWIEHEKDREAMQQAIAAIRLASTVNSRIAEDLLRDRLEASDD